MPPKPKLYYNSACPVCRTGIEQQRARMDSLLPDGSDTIAWCDIAATPEAATEVDRSVDQIRHSLHMVDENGRLLVGADVAIAVWSMTPAAAGSAGWWDCGASASWRAGATTASPTACSPGTSGTGAGNRYWTTMRGPWRCWAPASLAQIFCAISR